MKLRNKRTGEIGNFCYGRTNELCVSWQKDDGFWGKQEYNSLAELNEDWQDYEEPKEYWYISDFGYVFNHEIDNKSVKSTIEEMRSIGNYFLSREEAEKAVEKLKALKRLKDKGFRFYDYRFLCNDGEPHYIEIKASIDDISDPASKYARDLRLLSEVKND